MKKTILLFVIPTIIIIVGSLLFGCTEKNGDANGIIYGTVTDFATGEPVANANVKLRPSGETVLTGMDGSYQFNNIKDGQYSLYLSKNGYVDLDDNYIIIVEDGKNVRRDVQLSSRFESFILTVDGNEVDMIDFGDNVSNNSTQVSVLSNGSENISDIIVNTSTNWIEINGSTFTQLHNIAPNSGKSFRIDVKRSKLNIGNNTGYVTVSSGSLSKQLIVYATGVGVPTVSDPIVVSVDDNINIAIVRSTVTSTGGGNIIDKGFLYSRQGAAYDYYPYETISIGPGDGTFQSQVPTYGRGIYVCAYAKNGVHTGYSGWVYVE